MTDAIVTRTQRRRQRNVHLRVGMITVLSAVLMTVMISMLAFAIDLGYIENTRTEIQRATDAAAFAGAGQLVTGTGAATTAALSYLGANSVGGKTLDANDSLIEFGNWSTTSRTFTVNNVMPNAVRVTASLKNQPLFFAAAMGNTTFTMQGQSVAVYQPRDIGMVLDYSGSMCFDSQFRNLSLLGQAEIEANLQQIWTELGSPTYGTLTFTPVNYGSSSTKNSKVLAKFGLSTVAYPYPGGSWNEYVDYVQTDSYVNAAGYRNKYGMLTWLNYTLAYNCSRSETPGLDVVSEQPVTALKDAVDVFLSYLTAHTTDDRVSLSIYTYSDNTAILESALTNNYASIAAICRARQAAHYVGGTNISAGMTKSRVDLQNNGRTGRKK